MGVLPAQPTSFPPKHSPLPSLLSSTKSTNSTRPFDQETSIGQQIAEIQTNEPTMDLQHHDHFLPPCAPPSSISHSLSWTYQQTPPSLPRRMAAVKRQKEILPTNAPPPTPIATGKGTHSAAVNDSVLTEYLESFLKVPYLSLPENYPSPLRSSHHRKPVGIALQSLRSREHGPIEQLLASAADMGAFRIDGHDVSEEEVRSVMEMVGGGAFGLAEEKRRELGRWFGWGEGVREEFRWFRPTCSEAETALAEAWLPDRDTYHLVREKLESLSLKLESIADTIGQVLSEQLKNLSENKEMAVSEGSLLCLRKYDFHHLRIGGSSHDECNKNEDCPSHDLSLHLSLEGHEFCIKSQDGSTYYFSVPGGSIIVTVGRKLQEWCNGKMKGGSGEPIFDASHDPKPSFSLEFLCSPPVLYHAAPFTKIISLTDQILVVLVLAFLYSFWAYVSSGSEKS